MRMMSFPVAGGGGRQIIVNPDQVVCLMDMGERRTQIVTTGLAGASSVSIVVEVDQAEVHRALEGAS